MLFIAGYNQIVVPLPKKKKCLFPIVSDAQVTGGVWNFSRICCDVFVTLDVMMCTASILNLCAISIDR